MKGFRPWPWPPDSLAPQNGGGHSQGWNQGPLSSLEQALADRAMSKNNELRYGAPGETAVHLCVDMQRMFSEATDWKMPWLDRVLPNIVAITAAHPKRTIFTRFIPARKPGQGVGMWRHYYERWGSMTIDELGPEMIGLVPDLAKFVPPARTFDKHVYSPWTGSDLHQQLRSADIDTVIITGGETDVCVLSTMLGAIDWGFRVILVTDALCSSADETHDAMMNVYTNRFGEQVETVTTEILLGSWRAELPGRNVS
jgi:nicotinamidase-related amidase